MADETPHYPFSTVFTRAEARVGACLPRAKSERPAGEGAARAAGAVALRGYGRPASDLGRFRRTWPGRSHFGEPVLPSAREPWQPGRAQPRQAGRLWTAPRANWRALAALERRAKGQGSLADMPIAGVAAAYRRALEW